MKRLNIKIFKFFGVPVYFNLLFLLLFIFMPVSLVISFLISILVHEMAHAYMGIKRKCKVHSIKINLLYGCASVEPRTKKDTLLITLAGPLSNLILSLLFGGILLLGVAPPIISAFLVDMFLVNAALLIFNILPILPMDGGQILKNILLIKRVKNANKIANIVSLILATSCAVLSIIFGQIFLAIFMVIFAYLALTSLKIL